MARERADDVVVVGGGIIGMSIACEAARAGLRVQVFEKGRTGSEASGAAAGLLSPQVEAEHDDPLFRLALASRDLYPEFARRVAEESGVDPALSESGTLVVARPGEETHALDRRSAFQRSIGLQAERLGGDELRRMEPALGPEWREGLFLPRDGSVDNVLLMQALGRAAGRLGIRVQEGARVLGLIAIDGRITGVRVAGGSVPSGSVVIAAGAWSAELRAPKAPSVPAHPVRGQIVCFGPAAIPARPVFSEGCYLVPRRDGRVLAGSTMELAGFDARVTGAGLRDLTAGALALLPALAAAPFHSAWAGLRPATPDGLPAIGRAAPGLLYACGHLRNGILLAPVTALLIGRLLRDQEPGMDMAPFGPGRFGEGGAAARRVSSPAGSL